MTFNVKLLPTISFLNERSFVETLHKIQCYALFQKTSLDTSYHVTKPL